MNSISELFLTHRSIRRFKSTDVDQSLVTDVCSEAIAGASSSGNLNTVSIVTTRDEQRRQRLYELHSKQEMILQAPLLLTFCADFHRTRYWLARRGARDNFNNLQGYHIAALESMIVAQNVSLGFEARGLGICYMGTTFDSMPEIAELLELPETCLPVTTLVVGYPDEAPKKRDRLPMTAILHEERYQPQTEETIESTYAQREVNAWNRYAAMPELAALFKESRFDNVAQWYTSEYKYPPERFQFHSKKFLATLNEYGFHPTEQSKP